MLTPASTGVVATQLGTSEPRLNDLIRRQKIDPPPVVAGRRLWSTEHVEQAAEVLGVLTTDDALLRGEVSRG